MHGPLSLIEQLHALLGAKVNAYDYVLPCSILNTLPSKKLSLICCLFHFVNFFFNTNKDVTIKINENVSFTMTGNDYFQVQSLNTDVCISGFSALSSLDLKKKLVY